MHEAINKRHGKAVHIKVTLEPSADAENPAEEKEESALEERQEEIDPGSAGALDSTQATPMTQNKKPMSLSDHLTAGMRPTDEDHMMNKEPHGLHERVVKKAIMMKKKGKA